MRSGQATSSTPAALAVSALLVVSLAACGSTSSTAIEPSAGGGATRASAPGSPAAGETTSAPITPADTGPARTASGAYVDWSTYAADPARFAQGEVVLFFHAPWCPSCRATEESLDADGVPDGLTVVKVDFDTATDLRRRYGVTVQHTFVQIDGAQEELTTWTGSLSGADIAAQLA
jgi:thiol-disulfide isomerase/thioredoxin